MSTRVKEKVKTDTPINFLDLMSFRSTQKSHSLWVSLYKGTMLLASYKLDFPFKAMAMVVPENFLLKNLPVVILILFT